MQDVKGAVLAQTSPVFDETGSNVLNRENPIRHQYQSWYRYYQYLDQSGYLYLPVIGALNRSGSSHFRKRLSFQGNPAAGSLFFRVMTAQQCEKTLMLMAFFKFLIGQCGFRVRVISPPVGLACS